MGGIADYSGSLVLQMPIREACVAGVQSANDGIIQALSLDTERKQFIELASERIGELRSNEHRGKWYSYMPEFLRYFLTPNPSTSQAEHASLSGRMSRSEKV